MTDSSLEKIDFVITWVDGNDPVWQADKSKYSPNGGDVRPARYREWDQLKYWFRSIELYAPWVNKIHFVTYGHLPEWLDTSNPRLHIVNHSDFIPKEFLPVFNSTAIEIHLHRIPGLSEQFVYFNDDFYLMKECRESDFFVNGLPVDEAFFLPVIPHNDDMYFYHLYNDYSVYSRYFNRSDFYGHIIKYLHPRFIRNNFLQLLAKSKYIRPLHYPKSFLKSSFETVWKDHGDILNGTARAKFRSITDNSPELFRGYQIITGKFHPAYKRKSAILVTTSDYEKASSVIESGKYKFFVLNDSDIDDFETAKEKINRSFENVLPLRCSFEKKQHSCDV